jgi:hypothetical protein
MNSDSLEALRGANPRRDSGFMEAVYAAARTARPSSQVEPARPVSLHQSSRRRALRPVARAGVAALGVASITAAVVVLGSEFGTSTTPTAVAMDHAVAVSADAADDSGTVSVRITQDGNLWAAKTVRWNGPDLSISETASTRPGGRELRVVGGMMYGVDPERSGGWLELGPPENIDPGSGTTPSEYLAAVREDVGGSTLRRLSEAMTDLSTIQSEDGSTVYTGRVAASVLARETGFKEGRPIRVLPYGYVARDAAADPSSSITISIVIGADNAIKEIAADWGGASTWTYQLTFSDLGSTPAPTVPADVRSLLACRGPERDRSDC